MSLQSLPSSAHQPQPGRSATPLPPPPPRRKGSRAGRIAVTAVIAIVGLIGAAFVAAGALQSSEGGYFTTSTGAMSTPTRALVTREVDVDARRPADTNPDVGDLARVRILAKSDRPGESIFIGIAKRSDVEKYLRSVSYDEMASYTDNPLRVNYDRHDGTATPAPPRDQKFWVASAEGSGKLDMQWNKAYGEWMAVALNSDGSPDVRASASIGLRFGALIPIGIGLVAVALLLGAIVLRRRRSSTIARTDRTPETI